MKQLLLLAALAAVAASQTTSKPGPKICNNCMDQCDNQVAGDNVKFPSLKVSQQNGTICICSCLVLPQQNCTGHADACTPCYRSKRVCNAAMDTCESVLNDDDCKALSQNKCMCNKYSNFKKVVIPMKYDCAEAVNPAITGFINPDGSDNGKQFSSACEMANANHELAMNVLKSRNSTKIDKLIDNTMQFFYQRH